ncbi:unnamed protein product [Rhizophagus irregularis]|nr:unnamed protein product [Rhizophagus irregularis]
MVSKAANLGSIEAKLCLGYMCSIGFSILHYDPQKLKNELAIKWYKKSCELGDSQSAYNLGLLYENDQKIKNKSEAEKWFKMAVQFDNNNLYAKAKLGRILINKGNSDENEKMEGIEMLKYAAGKWIGYGQTFLGEAYERVMLHNFVLEIFVLQIKFLAGEEDIENVIKIYVEELSIIMTIKGCRYVKAPVLHAKIDLLHLIPGKLTLYLEKINNFYNEDNSVNVPFGRAAEWYIANHSLLKDRRLKSQSRLYTSELVKEGYITIQSRRRSRLYGMANYNWENKVY